MPDIEADVDVDVVIVGGGPVGFATALLLAQRGHTAHLIERHPEPYGRPRAVAIDPESMRLLQRLELLEDLLPGFEHTDYYDWLGVDGQLLLRFDRSLPAAPGWTPMIGSQPIIEELLERRANASPLITVSRGTEAVDIRQTQDRALVRLDTGDSISGRFVVGADGAHSRVRDELRGEVHDLDFFYDWLIVDVIPAVTRDWGPSSLQLCNPERPTTVVPGGAGRRRWEFMILPGEDPVTMQQPESVWRLLEPWDLDAANAEIERSAVYTFHAMCQLTWTRGRIAIAGDAAHLMPPFAGQGLNSGFRDAVNLAWKLDLALTGRSPLSILDSYTAERVEHIQHAIQFSVELGRVICVLDPDEARARDARMLQHAADPARALPRLPDAAFSRGIISGAPGSHGGTLAPQFIVTRPESPLRARFDDVFDTRGPLLLSRVDVDERSRERMVGLGGDIVRFGVDAVDVDGDYGREFDRLGADAAIVRPDGYYFGAGDAHDLAAEIADMVMQGRGR